MARRRISLEQSRRRRRVPTWKKALVVAGIIVALYIAVCVVWKVGRPVILAWQGKQECQTLEAQLAAKNREKQEMLAKRKYLRSPEGAETEARKLGYVKQGESSILIDKGKPQDSGDKK